MGMVTKIGQIAFSTGVRRKPTGKLGEAMRLYAVIIAVYTVYGACFSDWDNLARMIVFLCMMLVLVFLLIGQSPKSNPDKPSLTDFALSALAVATLSFFVKEIPNIAVRLTLFDPLTPSYYFFGLSLIVLSIEAARRTVGLGLTVIVGIFMGYNLFGHLLTGFMSHGYISLGHLIDITVFTSDGLFSEPIQVTASYAFMFVLFGTILERAGGGDFFFDMASVLTGRKTGGPAKIAVLSSAMFGTISGSPTSDVVTTGSVTIPMMKRLGYRAQYAAGVEVAASTGGSIMPPVMGSAVFIMAEFTGISYVDILVAAIVPAFIYYLGVYIQVHLRSVKLGHSGMPSDTIPSFRVTMSRGGLFLIPLVTLVVALILRYTPTYVALFGIISVTLVWMVRWQRFSFAALYDVFAQATFNMVAVTGACAVAGLVIGGITMTGLSGKVSDMIIYMAGNSELLVLFIAACCVILLGMGMPTPAAYALAAAMLAPTLIQQFNIPLMQAHLFLLYFAVLSAMTPPVAVAAYAASAIADCNPLGIAVSACRLAVAAFILPFAFIYNPGIMLSGSLFDIGQAIISLVMVVILVSIAAEGHFRGPLAWWTRLILVASAMAYFSPGANSLIIGSSLAALAWWSAYLTRGSVKPVLKRKGQ